MLTSIMPASKQTRFSPQFPSTLRPISVTPPSVPGHLSIGALSRTRSLTKRLSVQLLTFQEQLSRQGLFSSTLLSLGMRISVQKESHHSKMKFTSAALRSKHEQHLNQ